eukprot:13245243-Alexandrium_andersonii.AAC.1
MSELGGNEDSMGSQKRFQRDCNPEAVCVCTIRSAHGLSQDSLRIQKGVNRGLSRDWCRQR